MSNARLTLGTQEGITGGVSGAKIGGTYGGPVGAFWGAVIGTVVGTATGVAMGGSVNKARSFERKSSQIQTLVSAVQQGRDREAYRQQLLTEIRRDRVQRASALSAAVAAGAEEDSGPQGALSAIGSGISNAVQYMANDRAKVEQMQLLMAYSNYMNQKAQKKYKRAMNIKRVMDPIGATGADSGDVISSFKTGGGMSMGSLGNLFGGGQMQGQGEYGAGLSSAFSSGQNIGSSIAGSYFGG